MMRNRSARSVACGAGDFDDAARRVADDVQLACWNRPRTTRRAELGGPPSSAVCSVREPAVASPAPSTISPSDQTRLVMKSPKK